MSKPIQLLQQRTDNLEDKLENVAANTADIGKTVHLTGVCRDHDNYEAECECEADLYFSRIAEHVYNISGTVKLGPNTTGAEILRNYWVSFRTKMIQSDIPVGFMGVQFVSLSSKTLNGEIGNVNGNFGFNGEDHLINMTFHAETDLANQTIAIDCTFYSPYNITATESS